MIALYVFGALSLLDGIIFSLYKRSFLSPELGIFKVLEVEGIQSPDSIQMKTNKEKFAMFDGIYQKVAGEYCNGNLVWKHSDGTSKLIFFSNGGRWVVGTALVVKTSFNLNDSHIKLEGGWSE